MSLTIQELMARAMHIHHYHPCTDGNRATVRGYLEMISDTLHEKGLVEATNRRLLKNEMYFVWAVPGNPIDVIYQGLDGTLLPCNHASRELAINFKPRAIFLGVTKGYVVGFHETQLNYRIMANPKIGFGSNVTPDDLQAKEVIAEVT